MRSLNSPRRDGVVSLLQLYERQYWEQTSKRQLHQDNQFLKTYTEKQWLRIHNDWGERGTEISYRTKVDTMLGHYMRLRSSNRLDVDLADLFVLPMENEGGVPGSNPPVLSLEERKGISETHEALTSDRRKS